MRTLKLTKETIQNILTDLLKRSPNNYTQYESSVNEIIANVRSNGDQAVFDYTQKFDGATVTADNIEVTEDEIAEAYELVDQKLLEVIRKAKENIRVYHEKQKQYSWFDSSIPGNHAWSESNSDCKSRCVRSGWKSCISFFRTDEHYACKSRRCRRNYYDNSM